MSKLVPFFMPDSHKRKVCSLYKRACRQIMDWYQDKAIVHYQTALLRGVFDVNKHITDPCTMNKLLEEGEKELFKKQHWHPMQFPYSIRGNAYGRDIVSPDWVLDYWHPLEKAQYPKYFTKREMMKREFIAQWERDYGDSECK